jgi:subtilisin family serine protease
MKHSPIAAVLGLVLVVAACDSSPESITQPDQGPDASILVSQPDPIGPGVREAIQRDGRARVMVALGGNASAMTVRSWQDLPNLRQAVAGVQAQALAGLRTGDLEIAHQFGAVPALAGTLRNEAALERLAASPGVLRIDLEVGGTGTLATSVPQINADQRHAIGNEGDGIVVGVLDSGIDSDHPDLSDDVGEEACFGDNDGAIDGNGFCPGGGDRETGAGSAEDDFGHGTHVSGIITSNGSVASMGVAPGAEIVSVKVLDNLNRFFFSSEVVAGLQWIIDNNNAGLNLGVQVINMSLGTNALYNSPCDNTDANTLAMANVINTLRNMGVTVVVAAGNDGSGTQMNLPACVGNTISVGAVDANDDVADFSNSDATTDVFAPGTNVEDITLIISSGMGGGTWGFQGTSMAAPHVAGCAALLIESGDATTPNAIETRLETSSVQVTDPTNNRTFPRVDCAATHGTIIIRKVTEPSGRTGFGFSDDIEAPNAFTLDDGQSELFNDVVPGTYTVTEDPPGSFMTLTDLVCEDPSGGTSVDLPSRRASIDLAPGETVDCTFTNTDQPPEVTADPASQTVQYSDYVADITVTAKDSDQDVLAAAFSHNLNGGLFLAGLPADLSSTAPSCSVTDDSQTCTWTISGTAGVPEGTYVIRSTITDAGGNSVDADVTLIVEPEDATVTFDPGNPVGVEVAAPGEDSGPFSMTVYVEETKPDLAVVAPEAGDLREAVVTMSLVPVGPGGPVVGLCAPVGVAGAGYDQELEVRCDFNNVPVNTYTAVATVVGGYYAGAGEDVLTVFDPSLGFTTGGGWFYWPGTADRTNFGYTMKYNKKGKNVKGSLLMIRHLADGTKYRVKSNALYGLAIGDGGDFDWASFNGKATYLEPGWPEPVGNHEFVTYVEDWGEPGTSDRFWIQVLDKDGNVIGASSMTPPADGNAVTLEGGNIVVPHQNKGGKK